MVQGGLKYLLAPCWQAAFKRAPRGVSLSFSSSLMNLDSCCHSVTLTRAHDHFELYGMSMGKPFSSTHRVGAEEEPSAVGGRQKKKEDGRFRGREKGIRGKGRGLETNRMKCVTQTTVVIEMQEQRTEEATNQKGQQLQISAMDGARRIGLEDS